MPKDNDYHPASMVNRKSGTNVGVVRSLITKQPITTVALKSPEMGCDAEDNDLIESFRSYDQFLNEPESNIHVVQSSPVQSPTVQPVVNDFKTPTLPRCRVQRTYKCEKCQFSAQGPREHLVHLQQEHGEEIDIKACTQCTYASRYYPTLQRHIEIVHGMLAVRRRSTRKSSSNNNTFDDTLKFTQSLRSDPVVNKKSNDMCSFNSKAPRPQSDPAEFPAIRQQFETMLENSQILDNQEDVIAIQGPTSSKAAVTDELNALPGKSAQSLKTKTARRFSLNVELDIGNRTEQHLFTCNLCDYSTNMESRLKNHETYHSDTALKCDICDFRTDHKRSLQRHMLNHEGRGFLRCDLCSFRTDTKTSLRWHISNHHELMRKQAIGNNCAANMEKPSCHKNEGDNFHEISSNINNVEEVNDVVLASTKPPEEEDDVSNAVNVDEETAEVLLESCACEKLAVDRIDTIEEIHSNDSSSKDLNYFEVNDLEGESIRNTENFGAVSNPDFDISDYEMVSSTSDMRKDSHNSLENSDRESIDESKADSTSNKEADKPFKAIETEGEPNPKKELKSTCEESNNKTKTINQAGGVTYSGNSGNFGNSGNSYSHKFSQPMTFCRQQMPQACAIENNDNQNSTFNRKRKLSNGAWPAIKRLKPTAVENPFISNTEMFGYCILLLCCLIALILHCF